MEGPHGLRKLVSSQVRVAWIIRLLSLTAVLALWEAAVALDAIDRFFLAPPSAIFSAGAQLFTTGEIWPHINATAQEVAVGLAFGVLIGVPIGIVAGLNRLIWLSIEPFVMAMYSTPAVAFLPLLIIWFGTGLFQKSLLVFLGAVFPILIATQSGAANASSSLVETARSFWARRYHVVTKVIVPSALPSIVAGMRIAVGRALIMAVVAEFYAASAGIGYMIFRAGAAYDTARLFVGVVLLGIAGATLSRILDYIYSRISPWTRTG